MAKRASVGAIKHSIRLRMLQSIPLEKCRNAPPIYCLFFTLRPGIAG